MTRATTSDESGVTLRAAETAVEQVPNWCLCTLSGSRAYGTDHAGSDLDMMGVYIEPVKAMLSLRQPAQTRKLPDRDVTFYELSHFCKLAANANPTVLDVFAAPALLTTIKGARLRLEAPAFLSKRAVKTYGGYAISQIGKAERGSGGSRGVEHYKREKFLLHTLRLLWTGENLLRTGKLDIRLPDVESYRATAAAGLEATSDRAARMLAKLNAAAEASPLPDEPDWDRIDRLIYALRDVDHAF
jgi:predicted nucleotidyltransferase